MDNGKDEPKEDDPHWPFEAWLKLAVSGFRLAPSAFWDMSLQDWFTLTLADDTPVMTRADLIDLIQAYPDERNNEHS